jgi:PEP-CTERM motif
MGQRLRYKCTQFSGYAVKLVTNPGDVQCLPSFLPELTRGARAVLAVAVLTAAATPQVQATGVPGQGTWETTLQGRDLDGNFANGAEAYYDTALNITWLADANYAKTSGYDADGVMPWIDIDTWVQRLNVFGVSGWRLPGGEIATNSACTSDGGTSCGKISGYNVNTSKSELAHMFHVTLGNKAAYDDLGNSQSDSGLTNPGQFSNLYSTRYAAQTYPQGFGFAWFFNTYDGSQDAYTMNASSLAWVVHRGDVGVAMPVPEPQTYALILAGLAVVLVARNRKPR